MHPPKVQQAMESGRSDLDRIRAFMESPKAFLEYWDECGIERVGVINYVAPDVMGFTSDGQRMVRTVRRRRPRTPHRVRLREPAIHEGPGGGDAARFGPRASGR
jgi:hypothetical protein